MAGEVEAKRQEGWLERKRPKDRKDDRLMTRF
jgi:hypothetical protein